MPIWIIAIIVFFLLDLFFVIWILLKRGKLRKFTQSQNEYIRLHWENVMKVASFNPQKAVLDADKILDYALKSKGFEGNLGEKLKKAGPRFSDLNGVWEAHKLRNHLAHELSDVGVDRVRKALAQFKRALIDLGADLK